MSISCLGGKDQLIVAAVEEEEQDEGSLKLKLFDLAEKVASLALTPPIGAEEAAAAAAAAAAEAVASLSTSMTDGASEIVREGSERPQDGGTN